VPSDADADGGRCLEPSEYKTSSGQRGLSIFYSSYPPFTSYSSFCFLESWRCHQHCPRPRCYSYKLSSVGTLLARIMVLLRATSASRRVCFPRLGPVLYKYGPGSRVLYCTLRSPLQAQAPTATSPQSWRRLIDTSLSVSVGRLEWLRKACLAGALLFPAVAALHGIVLAAVHLDGEFSTPDTCLTIDNPVSRCCRCGTSP
jgi:hypothetical protein